MDKYYISPNSHRLIRQLVEDEFNEVEGSILLYEHQSKVPEKHRKIQPDLLKTLPDLRLYREELVKALNYLTKVNHDNP